MANTEKSSGSQTAVVGTTHTLLSTTDAGTYVLMLDLNALAANDVLEVYIETKVRTGDTVRRIYTAAFYGAQTPDVNAASVPLVTVYGADFKIKQTFGTGRAIPWAVYQVG